MKRIQLTPTQEEALRSVVWRALQPGYGPAKTTRVERELRSILQALNTKDTPTRTQCYETWPGRLSCPDGGAGVVMTNHHRRPQAQ